MTPPLTPAALRLIAQRATRRPSTATAEQLRRDVLALLDEVRRLRAEMERVEEMEATC